MKRIVLVAVTLLVVVLTARSSGQTVSAGPFVAGEILVKFRPGVNASARADAHRVAGATPQIEAQRTGVQRVRVRARAESAAIAQYRRNPNVLYAEPNFIRSIPTPSAHPAGSEVVPGDRYFHEQWGFDNTGQSFYCIPWISGELCLYRGTPDADIDAPEAWSITKGNSAVTVAVIDSGVDYTHPDLAANYAGGDDFVFSDGDPMDDHGHGTHVAGVIAAAFDNLTGTPAEAEGVVGIAPNARIRAYKVCRSDGTCDDFAIQQAIARAISDGVNVINMSLGGPEYSQSLNDAVQNAWNAGIVIVAAAGNNGTTDRFYPAALDNVISVAAFDEDHSRPSFSNYGSWVDISAPGNVIMSTYPSAACGGSQTPGDTGCYTRLTGTSMAAPHVSGAAALVWSRSDVTSNSRVVDILLNSADSKGVANVRLDSWTLHGGLNLHDAISYGLTNLPPVADAGADQIATDSNRDGSELVNLDGSASTDSDGSIVSYSWREGSTSVATGETSAVWLSVGVHTLTLEVTDDDGDSATDNMVVTVNPSNQVTVTASTSRATEAGPTSGMFTVSRTGDISAPLTVHYTVGGTAVAAADYLSLSDAVTLEVGSSAAMIAVTPIDDAGLESDEFVILTVSADNAYSLGSPSEAVVTIVSDDLPSDLIVASVVAPSAAGADADIVVTETTKNQGTGPSLPSSTGFYLSANTVLDASDVFLGSRSVPVLAPTATNVLSTTLHLPTTITAGTHFIFAKADWDNAVEEGVETNNVKASGVVKIGPDLTVSALVAQASAAAGGSLTVSDTTKNQGGGSADVSTTRFYLSANSVLDASDVSLGSRSVQPLGAGASDAVNTSLTLPDGTAAGTYYVIAQADTANTVRETSESNNNRASSAVKVGPDLLVSAVSAPSSAAAGATIAVTDTTKNQGAGLAAVSSTGFYLSLDASIGPTDVFLGSRVVGELGSGGITTASVLLQIPSNAAPGSYYVIARADWNDIIAETAENNNARASAPIKSGGDLVLAAQSASSTATANGPITVTDTTKNQGVVAVPESATGFYLSLNSSYDPMVDLFLGSRIVGPLGPSETSTASTQLVIPAGTASGSYYVIGVADWNGGVAESTESNNSRNSNRVLVGPDLAAAAVQ